MRLSALNRLRLSFVGIGALLLVPLALLADAVTARLEAQRRLRHEVVAERIFDELERELTAVLAQEFARPSSAYDPAEAADGPAPEYVLGYFTSAAGRPKPLVRAPTDEKERRVRWALGQWTQRPLDGDGPAAAPAQPAEVGRPKTPPAGSSSTAPPKPAPAPRSSPEILRKLNRGDLQREELGY